MTSIKNIKWYILVVIALLFVLFIQIGGGKVMLGSTTRRASRTVPTGFFTLMVLLMAVFSTTLKKRWGRPRDIGRDAG